MELLRQGKSPSEIAVAMGVNVKTTLAYLAQMVGEGRLRQSDVLLAVPAGRRRRPRNEGDKWVVQHYGSAEGLLGDIYEDVRFIEVTLHRRIQKELVSRFGDAEHGWWRQGIPLSVRKSCQSKREEDVDPVDNPYCYVDLVDLREIVDKKWTLLQTVFPDEYRSDKPRLMSELIRLNQVRRTVMHPVRGTVPTEEDFDFLRGLRRRLESLNCE